MAEVVKVGMVSLGCPKNQIDAEMMLYALKQGGLEIVNEESEADAIIINTCAFIEDAQAEAIENILEASKYKEDGNLKALIVTGCLAERFRDDVTEEIHEVDVAVGIGKNSDIAKIVIDAIEGKRQNYFAEKEALEKQMRRLHIQAEELKAFRESLDSALNRTAYEISERGDEDSLADAAIHFALLSYAAGVASNRYVAMLRRQKEAEQPTQTKKSKKEND